MSSEVFTKTNVPITNIILEFVAALFGIISVFYAKKENILVFPTGIISTALYVYLLSQWNLYGDLIIKEKWLEKKILEF